MNANITAGNEKKAYMQLPLISAQDSDSAV